MRPLAGTAAASADAPDRRHAAALGEYEASHRPQPYRAFAALAGEGHQPAAHVALRMSAHGHKLCGQSFEASAGQRRRWARLPACGGPILASMPAPQGR